MKTISNFSILMFCVLACATVALLNEKIEYFFLLPVLSITFFVIAVLTSGKKFQLIMAHSDTDKEILALYQNYPYRKRRFSCFVYAGCLILSAGLLHGISQFLNIQLIDHFVFILIAYFIASSIWHTLQLKTYLRILVYLLLALTTITVIEFTSYKELVYLGDFNLTALVLALCAHFGSRYTAKHLTSVPPTTF